MTGWDWCGTGRELRHLHQVHHPYLPLCSICSMQVTWSDVECAWTHTAGEQDHDHEATHPSVVQATRESR